MKTVNRVKTLNKELHGQRVAFINQTPFPQVLASLRLQGCIIRNEEIINADGSTETQELIDNAQEMVDLDRELGRI